MSKNLEYEKGLDIILSSVPDFYKPQPLPNTLKHILDKIMYLTKSSHGFIILDKIYNSIPNSESYFYGHGNYALSPESFLQDIEPYIMEQIGICRK
jgi:hypothetical protein